MTWISHRSTYPKRAALPSSRRRRISASGLRCSRPCRCRACGSVAAACMTGLTWTRGWTTISTEGGPKRRLYGP